MGTAQKAFVAPEGFHGDGLFMGGGWHQLKDVDIVVPAKEEGEPTHTTVKAVVLPADGNWSALAGLGFVEATMAEAAA